MTVPLGPKRFEAGVTAPLGSEICEDGMMGPVNCRKMNHQKQCNSRNEADMTALLKEVIITVSNQIPK